jgi:hypothetical protein
LTNSTIKIPFLVTNPISITVPIWLKIFQVWSNNHKEKTPAAAIGTVKYDDKRVDKALKLRCKYQNISNSASPKSKKFELLSQNL